MIKDLSSADVLALVENFLSWAFRPQVDKANADLFNIMRENYYAGVTPNSTSKAVGFTFRGIKFPFPDEHPRARLHPLDKSLHERMDALMAFTSGYEVEKEKVKFLFAAACSACDTCYQLPSLLPEVCSGFFNTYLSLDTGIIPDYVKPLDQTVILAFQEKHKTNLDTLYGRITKNILGIM